MNAAMFNENNKEVNSIVTRRLNLINSNEDITLKQILFSQSIRKCGMGLSIGNNVYFINGTNITIGDNVTIGSEVVFLDTKSIIIKDGVVIPDGTVIFPNTLMLHEEKKDEKQEV